MSDREEMDRTDARLEENQACHERTGESFAKFKNLPLKNVKIN